MWRCLRTLLVLSMLALLTLPLSASSALPAAVGVAVTIATAAWQGFNLLVVGARSAAVARADAVWVSDPPSITPEEFDEVTLEWETTQWNTGRASSESIAPAVAPSGNAITITAETNWEQTSFTFSHKINMPAFNFTNPDGVLWGKGFAFGTLEGIVIEEYGPWQREEKAVPPVAEIPLKYIISYISLPFEQTVDAVSLELKLHAWKMDDQGTEPSRSSWHEQILVASVSLEGPSLDYLQVGGTLNEDDFSEDPSDHQARFDLRLEQPIEREALLLVPVPNAERLRLAFGVELNGTIRVGKR